MKRIGVFFFLMGSVLLTSCDQKEPTSHSWLKGDANQRIDTVAKHLRGNDLVMWEVERRHEELYKAIQSDNIPYASYQLEKIIHSMKMGSERRPARKKSYDWFFEKACPPIEKALEQKENLDAAFEAFTNDCVTCHAMEKVDHMPVTRYWEREGTPTTEQDGAAKSQ